jgi:hypothetical protein
MSKEICLSVKNPVRINISIRQDLLADLRNLADYQGRSLSNLCAYLLEQAYKDATEQKQ